MGEVSKSKVAFRVVDQLEVIEVILAAIKKSELDCCSWSENSQKELAFEIGAAVNPLIEARCDE